jgi:DNA polymerase-4
MSVHQTHIAHFDLDAFFVSVERILDPSLKGKPLILGGTKERGVVSTCSYEARKFGVKSAMPMSLAYSLCPQGIFLKGSSGQYGKFSQWVTDIIAAKAPVFEKASIDEFYIDLTGMDRFFDPLQWTIHLREEIIDKTGLPISFGLASNKMVAKMATNAAKPNGFLRVLPEREKEFLSPLPVSDIPGVGEQTLKQLNAMGILTIGDLSDYPQTILESHFGNFASLLKKKALGQHDGIVHESTVSKSISTEHTFSENTRDLDFLMKELMRMTEKLGHELREDQKMATCFAIKIRYADFETHTKQISLPATSFDDEIIRVVRDLFEQLYDHGKWVRLIGIRFSELVDQNIQTHLFENRVKKANLYTAIDEVKNRYGKKSVERGK